MIRRSLLIGLAIGVASCQHATPTQPCSSADCVPVETLVLVCPSNVSLTTPSSTVTSATVTYAAPTVTGGTPPVAAGCTPASPGSFSAGTTTVTCTATDATSRTAACSLAVTVNVPPPPIPILQGTTFWAFGDSLTKGDNGCNDPCVLVVDTGYEYPTVLASVLSARYTQQTVTMRNFGVGGETAVDGVSRLRDVVLAAAVPDALLLLEGINDLAPGNDETPNDVINALRSDVAEARARGVKKIFLATLTPEIAGGSRAWSIPPLASSDLLATTNALIRELAAQESVVLVDAFGALNANLYADVSDPHILVSPTEYGDGLHLTRDGRAALAQAFFAAIEANFETTSSAQRWTSPSSRNRQAPAIRR